MMRRTFVAAGVALATALAGCGNDYSPTRPGSDIRLAEVVHAARVKHGLPALAVASFSLDSIEVAVDGVRRRDSPVAATPEDLFHLGSLAKGLLATTIASLVEDGTLSWSLTLGEAFPELAGRMDAAYAPVTLAQLLQNRAGTPGINDLEDFALLPPFAGDAAAQRQELARWVLTQPPAVAPGSYLYSSGGFALAAAIAERRTGLAWDTLVRERTLGRVGARMFVGWPLEAGAAQPAGHIVVGNELVPVEPTAGHLPAVIAPAGDLSMTVADYARYARLHLRALCGQPEWLRPETWSRLQTPVGDYAMGWEVLESADNRALTHTGSAATFYALAVLYRNQKHGFVLVVNAVSPEVDGALVDVITGMAPTLRAADVRGALAALHREVVR